MQTKNKIALIISFLSLFIINTNLNAEEFNISASEISIDKENNIIVGKGDVEVSDEDGKVIKSKEVIYEISKEFLTLEGPVEIFDTDGNILKTNRAIYDKINEKILTYENSELILKEGYKLKTDNILYDVEKKIISSEQNTIFKDIDGNTIETNMFQYQIKKNLFSSIGKIRVIDVKKNKYFFKELYIDTKKKEMIGSDVSVLLDQENFGVSEESDPRFVANDILITTNESILSKAVFTVCKKKDNGCPPWTLQAKKIKHDKIKKTIYYDNAVLKVYDIPVFYFPKFFHPDPTVKRKSGFLQPFFTDSTSVGTGFGLPYYWAISQDKDLTFTPKTYMSENILFLNEYRQAFRNGFLILDTSYTEGYKDTSSTKTDGSRNHIFAELNFDFAKNDSYESNISFKTQRVSNDTFFRIHDINTALVDSENTDLRNEINYNFSKDNMFLNISGSVYENLRDNSNSRYEYVLPNILYGKSFFTKKFGTIDFESNAYYSNYSVNKHTTFLDNDIIWSSNSFITKKGLINTFGGMLNNKNYEAKNTTEYKTKGTINELSGVLTFKSSLPLKKESNNYTNILSPNFMLRYAPGHMRNLSGDGVTLNYSNLFATNKTSVIENGLNAILGFDFQINKKYEDGTDREKFSISMGQILSPEENKDMPTKSSLHRKTSDIVGKMNYNFSKIGNIGYKFSLDDNLNDLNYNEVSTTLNFGKVAFNLDYLEEQNHVGSEHYVNSGISLVFNNHNKLRFSTKKNFKTESTEFYDISYQYSLDCLTAGLVYRREFYEDSDVEQKSSFMFTITFVPFTGFRTPVINP